MLRLRKRKNLAILMISCMLCGMLNAKAYAGSSTEAPEPEKQDIKIQSFGIGDTVLFVGGAGAQAGNDGSSSAPYLTLKEAADAINMKDPGSYQVILQGDTTEAAPISFGNGSDAYNVSVSVSGSAIVSKVFTDQHLVSVSNNATLSLSGASDTQRLIFDGGGDSLQGSKALLSVSAGGTLNLNTNSFIQNNVVNTWIGFGGGIYNEGTLIMNGGNVSYNSCYYEGSGIYNKGTFLLEDGVISNNTTGYYGYGTGIYNAGTLTINGGTLTQNTNICLDNAGTVTMNAGSITANDCYGVVWNSGSFEMNGGVISNNSNSENLNNFSVIHAGGGNFKLINGQIEGNNGGQTISVVNGNFLMSGGVIRNNSAGLGVVRASGDGSFEMSGGEISNNTGDVFLMTAPILLSGNASISGKDGGVPEVYMENYSGDYTIDVSGSLPNISAIKIRSSLLQAGKQIVTGTGLTEELLAKFQISDPNYTLDNTGKLTYCGEPLTLYVDAAGSDNEGSDGSSSEPLLTFEEALDRIGSAHGTIIVQSDMDITDTIYIHSNITIKSDGQNRTLHQGIPYSGDGFDSMFLVNFGKLTLGDKEQTTGELIIENSTEEIVKLIDIENGGTVNLYNHASIQNNNLTEGAIYNNKSVFNLDGGSILNCTGTAIKNKVNGTVNLIAGNISAAAENNDNGKLIINPYDNTLNMTGGIITGSGAVGGAGISNNGKINFSGGTITGFNGADGCGILNEGDVNLSGGIISNNTYGLINQGILSFSGNVAIPAGADYTNMVYLPNNSEINLAEGLQLSEDNQISVLLSEYYIDNTLLQGDSEVIMNNHGNFLLADDQYGVSEIGRIIYIGEPPVYYVDALYSGGDSDGSIEKPFTDLQDAADAINSTVKVGSIYICSDLELAYTVGISCDITMLNNGPDPHTIKRSGTNSILYIAPEGSLTLGSEGTGSDVEPSLLFNGEVEEGITDAAGLISSDGVLNIYSGIKMYGSVNPDNYIGAIRNEGEFHMYGGIITDNIGRDSGGVINRGTFIMEGGRISFCNGEKGGALYNETSGTFIMSGGTIVNNNPEEMGAAIYNMGTIHISENANVPMGVGGSNFVCLENNSYIIIDKDLISNDKILITTTAYIPGGRLLAGEEAILNNNYQKFILEPSVTSYRLAEDGTLVFIGDASDYYVDRVNGDDNYDGSLENPFATLERAITLIEENSGVGTVHICSNLELKEPVIIRGSITLLNEGEPHTILRSQEFDEASCHPLNLSDYGMIIVFGQLELGSKEMDGLAEAALLTFDGNKDNITANGALISNYNSLILHNGIVIQNNNSGNYYGGGIYNNGTFIMKGGVIQNTASQYPGGLYNNVAKASILGGSIRNNEGPCGGGICCDYSEIKISGGEIRANKAETGGGLYVYETDAIISGGAISENLALDEAKGINGKGVYVDWNSTFTVLKDASIASDNDVSLYSYDDWEVVITVGGSLSENIPVITISKLRFDNGLHTYVPDFHTGDQVIVPGDGYTLTAQDISKFIPAVSNYAINNLGRIASDLDTKWFTLVNASQPYYTGSEIKPGVNTINTSEDLEEGTDYQVSYKNNVNAGTATVYIDGMGDYGGRITKLFTIYKATIQSIATSAPAARTVSAAKGMTLEELRLSIPLNQVTVNYSHGTANLPITWALTEGNYQPKGGSYTFTGTLNASDNFETEDKAITARITVTPFTLSKPTFIDTSVTVGTDGQVTANELGNTKLPTSGTIQADGTAVNYTIAWDSSTLNGSTVGASNTFHGTITYTNAPGWATLPADLSVSRKVSVTAADVIVTPPPTPGEGSTPVSTPTPTPGASQTPTGTNSDRVAEVSVTIGQNRQNQELNTTVSISEASLQELLAAGAAENTELTIPIDSEELTELMKDNSFTSINIDLVVPNSINQNEAIAGCHIQLDAAILEAAKENEKDVHISVKDEEGNESYSWSFTGADLAASGNAVTELDLSLKVERLDDQQEFAELLGSEAQSNGSGNNVLIDFSHHGTLPAQASIRIFVGNMGYSEGDQLYLYYYNSETGKLDTLPFSSGYQVDSEGYVTVDITHCSEYVLLPQQAAADIITPLRDQISITPDQCKLYLGATKHSTAAIGIKLPETLELVKDIKDKTSGSAIGAVVLTYQSSNPKVASVDSSGTIIAGKRGEAVIKVTVTLYNGKSRTYKIPITVEKPYILPISSTATMKLGESFTFTAKAFGLEAKDIVWKTTKKSIVTIDKKTGKAKAVKKGTDYIIASINNVTVQIKVTVK